MSLNIAIYYLPEAVSCPEGRASPGFYVFRNEYTDKCKCVGPFKTMALARRFVEKADDNVRKRKVSGSRSK